jgi:hypothetical protein
MGRLDSWPKETKMNVKKHISRTRKLVVEVETESVVWFVTIVDHFDSESPMSTRAGEYVSISAQLKRRDEPAAPVPNPLIPIRYWPLIRDAVDRAIKEFKTAYPESPQ